MGARPLARYHRGDVFSINQPRVFVGLSWYKSPFVSAHFEQRNAQGTVVREYFDQGFTDSGTVYYYGLDHLGSIRNLTDASGTIQAQLDYGLYGEVTDVSGSIQPDFAYTGLFYHQRSGLYFAEYRAYDCALKRWLNRDLIGEAGGINLYEYVLNNPISLTDLTGRQATCDGKPSPTPTPSPKPTPKKPDDPNKLRKDKARQLLKDLFQDGPISF
jgi:RHS repeat-associated protein